MLTNLLLVGAGSACGGALRWWLGEAMQRRLAAEHLHLGHLAAIGPTVLINAGGSLLIGLLAALLSDPARAAIEHPLRLFLIAGFCGGFTTFSTFSLQNLVLLQDGQWSSFLLHSLVSVTLCLVLTACGWWLGRAL
ncbi:fluoride efflux transporter CrcB [Gammaproteobacteria bacterium]|nr:fluoride efflux transporter CrcB [Gammaproteobacteria bacterium]